MKYWIFMGNRITFICAYNSRCAFSIVFSFFSAIQWLFIVTFLFSTLSHLKFFYLPFDMHVQNWTRTNKQHTHPNGNWHEIGLFAVQLCHLSIVKAFTENRIIFVCVAKILVSFLRFFLRVLLNFFLHNCPNEWNEMERLAFGESNEAMFNWQMTRGRVRVGIFKIDDIRMKREEPSKW